MSNSNAQLPARANRQDGAFSLLELFIVIAILTFCSLLLTTALARTTTNTKGFRCLNNMRQFIAAWTMYAADHSDQVANNFIVAGTMNSISDRTNFTWVGPWLPAGYPQANNFMSWGPEPSNTNTLLLKEGLLGPYLNNDVAVFRCPADNYLSPVQLRLGWSARVRSISMNAVFGRLLLATDSGYQPMDSQHAEFLKLTKVPKPSRTWVVLDEHPDSIQDGAFLESPTAASWGDLPACYHAGGCGFAFADGHTEIKKWLSATSKFPVRYTTAFGVAPAFDTAGEQDFQWYLERTGYVDATTGRPLFGY